MPPEKMPLQIGRKHMHRHIIGRRTFVFGAAFLFAATASTSFSPVRAADFPNRPVRIVVPWPAGGPTDAVARVIAQEMSEELKQPFVIDNKAGATGSIGSDNV